MPVQITQALLDLFKARHIAQRHGGGPRWQVGEWLNVGPETELEPYCHIFKGSALPTRMGAFSYTLSATPVNVRMGRYCSLGAGIEFIQTEHPTDWVSSSPFSYYPYGLEGFSAYLTAEKKLTSFPLHDANRFRSKPVTIGHDVWIGQDATFSGGIEIGHGAVIGACAVVTKDVPPYAIVGGVPARTIRLRFAETIVERLLELRPWRFGPDVLQPLDVRDPEGFIGRLEERLAADPPDELDWPPLTYAEIAAAANG